MSEKTEPPTPKKLRDAREKGNLLKSQEVVSSVVMLVGVLAVFVLAAEIPRHFRMSIDEMLRLITLVDSGTQATQFAGELVAHLLAVAGMVFGAIVLAAVLANVAQIGIYFSFSRFSKGLDSLNPVDNAKNLFSKKTLTQFGVNLLKVIVILGIAWWFIGNQKGLVQQIYLCRSDVLCGLREASMLAFKLLLWTTLAMLPIAIADWVLQRHFYMKDLMMSIDEVHREYKEQEGSPEMKGHRKQVAHEIVHEDPAPRAKDASVVVRNPTHVAVALRYEPELVPLPYIICKGMGREAERIIAEAERNGVPTFEDVPLARGLNDACEVGEAVPTAYIEPVARVIRWLYLNYPQRVFDGQDPSIRHAVTQSRPTAPSSYREGSTYGNARTFGNREPM
jgi:type III secretion protein U